MKFLPNELLYQIILNATIETLFNLCLINTTYALLCSYRNLWKDKLKHEFPLAVYKFLGFSDQRIYKDLSKSKILRTDLHYKNCFYYIFYTHRPIIKTSSLYKLDYMVTLNDFSDKTYVTTINQDFINKLTSSPVIIKTDNGWVISTTENNKLNIILHNNPTGQIKNVFKMLIPDFRSYPSWPIILPSFNENIFNWLLQSSRIGGKLFR